MYTSNFFFFFFNDTATTEIYTLSLHDALPISPAVPVPAATPSTYTVMVLPGSAVPLKVGVLSLVTSPLIPSPSVGALGAVVSTVRLSGSEGGLVLPAGS